MAHRTRKALAEQVGWAGKQNAKECLRRALGALAKVDLTDADNAQSTAAFLEAGRAFKDLVQSLFKQMQSNSWVSSASVCEETMFVRCLQQWTPPSSPETSFAADRSTILKGKGKRVLGEGTTVSLSNIKQIRDLLQAFPGWEFDITIPKQVGELKWRKRGPNGSLPFDLNLMSEEAVAAVSEVVFLALYFSESFHRYGGGTGDLPAADEYKYYVQVCTVLTAIAAFSDVKRLTLDGWSPESETTAAEQQTVDGLITMLAEASLAVSHEQQIRGAVTRGRTQVAVIEEKDEWARHRGCAEVKKSLVEEYNGVAQCIGCMVAQVEQNWRLDDEAEQRPGKVRRASDVGDTIILQGEDAEAGPSTSIMRTSSSGLNEGAATPRKETLFGVPTDSKNWLVLHMFAERDLDGKLKAKVTASGWFNWRGMGEMGLSG